MAKDKLSTQEILALARKQDAGGGAGGSSAADSAPPEQPAAEAQPAAEPPAVEEKPVPKAAPKSTADILAAARAQASGKPADAASAAPAAEKPAAPKAAPKSTADILAAARAQGSGADAGGSAAPKAAPKSTADILAAARAQKAPGAAPVAAAGEKKSAPAKAKAAAPAAAAGDRPPVAEMVKALHEGRPKSEVAVKPKLPSKPPLPARRAEPAVTRRAFPVEAALAAAAVFTLPFALGMLTLGAIGGLWGLLAARFMMPNMVVELPSKFKVGAPSDFPLGTVSAKYKASRGIWVVHSTAYNGENILYALTSVCTHLGCTPNWLEGEQKFKCPCHGSGFYISGINFEGPAPRPLERAGIRVAEDGMLEVDKSVKFQEELGQWADQKSYVALG